MVDVRQARLYGQRDLKVEVGQVPEPGAGQVLLKMAVGGICGSDLHYYQDGGFGPVRVREPIIVGHEASGYVEGLGAGVSGLAIGDLVWFRHAKSGELAEHVRQVHLVSGDRVVEVVPTYRGTGNAW